MSTTNNNTLDTSSSSIMDRPDPHHLSIWEEEEEDHPAMDITRLVLDHSITIMAEAVDPISHHHLILTNSNSNSNGICSNLTSNRIIQAPHRP
jgi:hypothetical protein